jgi:UDP-glucuronate 4-epimerase
MAKHMVITGAAGFIGFHLARALLEQGHAVTGIDNLNAYYDPSLKKSRLEQLTQHKTFTFLPLDIAQTQAMSEVIADTKPSHVIHLAAQAGVRYGLEAPMAYAHSNLTGTLSVLEACRTIPPEHVLMASSSSVYGGNRIAPFAEHHTADHPVSLYAATKRANELKAHAYAHLFGLPITMLRFFTVYGPWGRPDMAMYKFALDIIRGEPLSVYGEGAFKRDFTAVEDVIAAMLCLLPLPPERSQQVGEGNLPLEGGEAPFRILNIGHQHPHDIMHVISLLEKGLGRKAQLRFEPAPAGDVAITSADSTRLQALTGYTPRITLEEGTQKFLAWFKDHHRIPPC